MRFVARGAVRIDCPAGNHEFNQIAFRNPDGSIVLIAVNTTAAPRSFAVVSQGRFFRAELGARSVATLAWPSVKRGLPPVGRSGR